MTKRRRRAGLQGLPRVSAQGLLCSGTRTRPPGRPRNDMVEAWGWPTYGDGAEVLAQALLCSARTPCLSEKAGWRVLCAPCQTHTLLSF